MGDDAQNDEIDAAVIGEKFAQDEEDDAPTIGPSTRPMPPMTVMKIHVHRPIVDADAENGVMLSFCRNISAPAMPVAAAAETTRSAACD